MCISPLRPRIVSILGRVFAGFDGSDPSLAAHFQELGAEVSSSALCRYRNGDREPPLALLIGALDHASRPARLAMLQAFVGTWNLRVVDPAAAAPEDLVVAGLRLVEGAARWSGAARAALADGRLDELEREALREDLARLRAEMDALDVAGLRLIEGAARWSGAARAALADGRLDELEREALREDLARLRAEMDALDVALQRPAAAPSRGSCR